MLRLAFGAMALAATSLVNAQNYLTDDKVLSFDLHKNEVANTNPNSRASTVSAKTVDQPVSNDIILYSIDFYLGTPPQRFSLQVDTGSSDLWVTSFVNPYCIESGMDSIQYNYTNQFPCEHQGMYDQFSSSSYKYYDSDVFIRYSDYTYAKGDFVSDTLTLSTSPEVVIQDMKFAVAQIANTSGVFGIGIPGLESTAHRQNGPFVYDNFPVRLKRSGYINSVSYSIWLNSASASMGQLLFGGVDNAKYEGPIVTVPMVPTYHFINGPKEIIEFTVGADSVSFYNDSCSQPKTLFNGSMIVLADIGATASILPTTVVDQIVQLLNLKRDVATGEYMRSCTFDGDDNKFITISIGGFDILVPVPELLIPATDRLGSPLFLDDGSPACYLGVYGTDDPTFCSFGDNILRSTYMVFDLENLQIGFARAIRDTTASNIVAIESGIRGIPGSVPINEYVRKPLKCKHEKETGFHATYKPRPSRTTRATPSWDPAPWPEESSSSQSVSTRVPPTITPPPSITAAPVPDTTLSCFSGTKCGSKVYCDDDTNCFTSSYCKPTSYCGEASPEPTYSCKTTNSCEDLVICSDSDSDLVYSCETTEVCLPGVVCASGGVSVYPTSTKHTITSFYPSCSQSTRCEASTYCKNDNSKSCWTQDVCTVDGCAVSHYPHFCTPSSSCSKVTSCSKVDDEKVCTVYSQCVATTVDCPMTTDYVPGSSYTVPTENHCTATPVCNEVTRCRKFQGSTTCSSSTSCVTSPCRAPDETVFTVTAPVPVTTTSCTNAKGTSCHLVSTCSKVDGTRECDTSRECRTSTQRLCETDVYTSSRTYATTGKPAPSMAHTVVTITHPVVVPTKVCTEPVTCDLVTSCSKVRGKRDCETSKTCWTEDRTCSTALATATTTYVSTIPTGHTIITITEPYAITTTSCGAVSSCGEVTSCTVIRDKRTCTYSQSCSTMDSYSCYNTVVSGASTIHSTITISSAPVTKVTKPYQTTATVCTPASSCGEVTSCNTISNKKTCTYSKSCTPLSYQDCSTSVYNTVSYSYSTLTAVPSYSTIFTSTGVASITSTVICSHTSSCDLVSSCSKVDGTRDCSTGTICKTASECATMVSSLSVTPTTTSSTSLATSFAVTSCGYPVSCEFVKTCSDFAGSTDCVSAKRCKTATVTSCSVDWATSVYTEISSSSATTTSRVTTDDGEDYVAGSTVSTVSHPYTTTTVSCAPTSSCSNISSCTQISGTRTCSYSESCTTVTSKNCATSIVTGISTYLTTVPNTKSTRSTIVSSSGMLLNVRKLSSSILT